MAFLYDALSERQVTRDEGEELIGTLYRPTSRNLEVVLCSIQGICLKRQFAPPVTFRYSHFGEISLPARQMAGAAEDAPVVGSS